MKEVIIITRMAITVGRINRRDKAFEEMDQAEAIRMWVKMEFKILVSIAIQLFYKKFI